MVADFERFVEAYRNEDAIMIECGYKYFLPIWYELGQNKYVERVFQQYETLYRDFVYSRLQELRINRTFRKYQLDGRGKHSVAIDENIELWHSILSHYPFPKSLDGFVKIGSLLGVGERCKRFTDTFYNIGGVKEEIEVHMQGIEPSMNPEMKFIFEALCRCRTHTEISGRALSTSIITSIKDDIKTDLTRSKKKWKVSGKEHSYSRLVTDVEMINDSMQTARERAHVVEDVVEEANAEDEVERADRLAEQTLEGEADDDEDEDVDEAEDDGEVGDVDEAEDDGNVDGAGSSKSKRRRRRQYKIHLKAIANNFANGNKKLKEKPTGSTRAMGKARSERKRRLMKALVEWFGAAVTKKVSVGRERPDLPLPPWRMNPYSDS